MAFNLAMRPVNQPLEDAIAEYGVSNLARLAKVSPQVINNASRRGSVSPELAAQIEKATDGKVTRESLVWPPAPRTRKRAA